MMQLPRGYEHLEWKQYKGNYDQPIYALAGTYAQRHAVCENWNFALIEDHGASWHSQWWDFMHGTGPCWIDQKRYPHDMPIEQVMHRVFAEGLLKGYLRHALKPNPKLREKRVSAQTNRLPHSRYFGEV